MVHLDSVTSYDCLSAEKKPANLNHPTGHSTSTSQRRLAVELEKQFVNIDQLARKQSVEMSNHFFLLCHTFTTRVEPLVEFARRKKESWHCVLTKSSIAGLWEQRATYPSLVMYTIANSVILICLVTKSRAFPSKLHDLLSHFPGYIEYGEQYMSPLNVLRTIVFWDPPSTMVWLWPPGLDGETHGRRVVDSGNMFGYFSSVTEQTCEEFAEVAGQDIVDYSFVPDKEHGEFIQDGKVYRYLNRWWVVSWNS